jgi:secreted trypsin-like serine protease
MGLARIVGGAAVTPFEHNWVSLLFATTTNSMCGASLLDGEWALTAAHCTEGEGATIETLTHHTLSPSHHWSILYP